MDNLTSGHLASVSFHHSSSTHSPDSLFIALPLRLRPSFVLIHLFIFFSRITHSFIALHIAFVIHYQSLSRSPSFLLHIHHFDLSSPPVFTNRFILTTSAYLRGHSFYFVYKPCSRQKSKEEEEYLPLSSPLKPSPTSFLSLSFALGLSVSLECRQIHHNQVLHILRSSSHPVSLRRSLTLLPYRLHHSQRLGTLVITLDIGQDPCPRIIRIPCRQTTLSND